MHPRHHQRFNSGGSLQSAMLPPSCALEQGINYCSGCYRRNLHPVCGFHGDSHPSDHVEGRTRDA